MKTKAFIMVLALVATFSAFTAEAATPIYQIIQNGATAQITITNADANAPVVLYYYPQGSSFVGSAGTIGTTNSSGYFSTNVTSSTYSIPSGTNTYVTVNGLQSQMQAWPYFTGGGLYSTVILSQSNLSLNVGQSSSVTVSGGNGSYYISSNSNPTVVSPSLNGSLITLTPLSQGSSTIIVCSNGTSIGTTCANLFVTVSGTTNSNLQLSQNNFSLTIGQVSVVTAQNYTGSMNLSVTSNSNPGVVTATASGNTIYISAVAAGTSTVVVCNNSGYSACATMIVTVTNLYNGTNQNVTLAQSSVAVSPLQSQSVAIYGSGNYYVTSNTNPNIATAYVVGSNVSVQGITPGSTTVTVCANQYSGYTGGCATLFVTVSSAYYGGYINPTYIPPTYVNQYPGNNAVYLSQVPYTGFADNPELLAFVSLIVGFSAFASYLIVGKKVLAFK